MSRATTDLSSTTRRKLRPLKLAKAVAWSFFGVRKGRDHEQVIASLTLLQVVLGAVLGGAIIVACFATVAKLAAS
ncbi:MAG: DUF2970 domain-containing protein [Burkholderiales bacterium]